LRSSRDANTRPSIDIDEVTEKVEIKLWKISRAALNDVIGLRDAGPRLTRSAANRIKEE